MSAEMSDAALWDYLQERFGFGDWDETTARLPWWKYRGNAIGQLKAMKRKRRATNVQLVTAADYAIAHRKPVIALWQLFALIPEAMAWQRRHERAERTADLAVEIETAMHEAWEAGEHEWAGRLLRASSNDAQTVINEWRNR